MHQIFYFRRKIIYTILPEPQDMILTTLDYKIFNSTQSTKR